MNSLSDDQLCTLFKQVTGYEVDTVFVREFRRWYARQLLSENNASGDEEHLTQWLWGKMQCFVDIWDTI